MNNELNAHQVTEKEKLAMLLSCMYQVHRFLKQERALQTLSSALNNNFPHLHLVFLICKTGQMPLVLSVWCH
jgi:hypothetical protein